MKRWLINGFIAGYLGLLTMGIASHALNTGITAHPGMYYIVWDMFCGWSAHSSRLHLVAQGESGKYYELTPAPWGEIKPYGNIGRVHYDVGARHTADLAANILKHTSHEEMTRVFVIEESWPKKYNLPDSVWERTHDEPKDPIRYFYLRQIISPDGVVLQSNPTWLAQQYMMAMCKNPRLQGDMHRSRPFIAVSPEDGSGPRYSFGTFEDPGLVPKTGSTLGD
jgi:hypothetical protein